MASVKRKAVTDDRPIKKAKRVQPESKATKPAKRAADEDSSERRPVPKSVLQQEDRAFPRGGAGLLTPLEHKQIKAQAERDVLFEQQTGRPAGEEKENDDLFEDRTAAAPAGKGQKRSKRGDEVANKDASPGIKIQGLSYKNLVVGSAVLGHVTAITSRDIALALANNLTGYVPLTAVSETMNTRIENLLRDEGRDAKDGTDDDDDDVDLKRFFHLGQWLRATVTSTGSDTVDGNGRNKRHIELSVDPRQVNGGLDTEGVATNSMIQASVRSVEDHGIIMDLGLSDPDIKGFISKKELGTGYKLEDLQEGQAMLCLVSGKGSNGKVLKLSPDAARFSVLSGGKNAPSVSEAPTVNAFQPGTAVDVLVTESGVGGVVGKVMGMLDVTADMIHSGAGGDKEDLVNKYKIGSKTKGRIVWTTPTDDNNRRIGISLLEHMLILPPPSTKLPEAASTKLRSKAVELEEHLPLSSIVENAQITRVLAARGLFMTLPEQSDKTAIAFSHISQVSDSRVDTLSSTTGTYKLGSTHKARIMSYNPIDDLYYVSLKKSILDQTYLRIEDLTVGEIVKGTIDRIILGAKGVTGALVKLSDSITALVPEMHFSDVHLQHPERKFKEGFPVKARLLSVDLEKRHVRLTLKKTLVSEVDVAPIWKDYAELEPGMESKGTIINLLPNGAVVQFYGGVRAWLPVAEMSEAFIENPEKYFRLGQTVSVRILSLDAKAHEMKVSCKAASLFDDEQQQAWDTVASGQLVSGTVTEKNVDSVTIELETGLKGLLRTGHLVDGSAVKAENALKKIHLGQKLSDMLVLGKVERSRHFILSNKPSMVSAARSGSLVRSFSDLTVGKQIHGFVRNTTPEAVFIEFANDMVGLLPKSQITPEMLSEPGFGLRKDQSVSVWIMSVDSDRERFTLSMREQKESSETPRKSPTAAAVAVSNAVDSSITSTADLTLDKITKARIASVKATQINVRLADNVQGRVDVSEVFDSWDDVSNKKAPLQKFKPNEVLDVKILGVHDARNHRFLPISHRQSSVPVFELSAKRSRIEGSDSGMTMDSVEPGSTHLAFINNHGDNCVWVNLSPNARGRIALMELSNDVGTLQNLNRNFPIGSALKVTVKSVDAVSNRLDLRAETGNADEHLTLQNVSTGMILGARVTKVTDRCVNVQLSESLAGPVPLAELSDDYDQLNLAQYNKHDIVRVVVLGVDLPNKKLFLSMRPSKVLSSSLPVKDAQVTTYSQVEAGDVVRGFVKHISEKGVHVSLGAKVDAFVRISDLSDRFVKDWMRIVQVDQLVKGRVLSVDAEAKQVLVSLKASHVDDNFTPPFTISELEPGMAVTGKVRKVEDFGAFIDLDNTQPRLSGLCHRSEVAAKRVEDVRKLYSAGDVVKAKILSVDVEARKISLGLKASYFADEADGEEVEDHDEVAGGVQIDEADAADLEDEGDLEVDGGVDLDTVRRPLDDDDADASLEDDAMELDGVSQQPTRGLKTSGFDWTGNSLETAADGATSGPESDLPASKKRKRHKPEIKLDLTGDLDKYGPQTVDDFERQLLGQPNDSSLWVQYMALQLQLSEVQKAREIAERALRTIHIRETEEKANVWIAWMNLEVEYGDEDHTEDVFKQACQLQDPLEMHEKLASIYIDSGKHDKANGIFENIVGNKTFRASPEVWLNYANFLMDTLKSPLRARALLSRALQSVPTNGHRLLTAKFAALEFRSPQGDTERGRTIFEGLVSEWPKWSSGWDMFVDLERSRMSHAQPGEAKVDARAKVRALYERMASQKMKNRRAKFLFKRWLEFEEAEGDAKSTERVKAVAKAYVEAQQAKGGNNDEE